MTINRFQINDTWFTSEENEIGLILEGENFTIAAYNRHINDGETEWDEYAIVRWEYGAGHLVCVLSMGAFIDANEYLSRPQIRLGE